MHPRSRRGVGRSPSFKKSRRLSVLIVIIIIISSSTLLYIRRISSQSFLPLLVFAIFDSVTGSHAQRKYILSLPFLIFSSFFSSSSTLIFFTHDRVRKRRRQRAYPDIPPPPSPPSDYPYTSSCL